MKASNPADVARYAAKREKEALQRAEADSVWRQIRADQQLVSERTAKLRALRLERETREAADKAADAEGAKPKLIAKPRLVAKPKLVAKTGARVRRAGR